MEGKKQPSQKRFSFCQPSLLPNSRHPPPMIPLQPMAASISRKFTWNRLLAMAAVGRKVRAINRPHLAAIREFRHPHDASIRQVHRQIAILSSQAQKLLQLLNDRKSCIQNQIASLHQPQHPGWIRKEATRLDQNSLAGVKRSIEPEFTCRPRMIGIIARQQADDDARVSDVFHGIFVTLWRSLARTAAFVAGRPSPTWQPTKSSEANLCLPTFFFDRAAKAAFPKSQSTGSTKTLAPSSSSSPGWSRTTPARTAPCINMEFLIFIFK